MEFNISKEKLQLIQLLLKIENPSVIKRVKDLLTEQNPAALSKEDIINRANLSEIAFQNGKTLTLEQLEKETGDW